MGFFSFVGNQLNNLVNNLSEIEQQAQLNAEKWTPERICKQMGETSNIAELTGYSKVLKSKTQNMDSHKLKRLFDDAYKKGNKIVCSALLPAMEKKHLAYKDKEGNIRKRY